jgi:hypothetical protein
MVKKTRLSEFNLVLFFRLDILCLLRSRLFLIRGAIWIFYKKRPSLFVKVLNLDLYSVE